MNSVLTCAIIRTGSFRKKWFKMTNLSSKINTQLPAALVGFMQSAGAIADYQGHRLYLVGGVVRDLLLGQANLDLDLVVEGDAINLAQQLANITRAKITTHPRFNTAKIRWDRWSVDIATARSETYERPGALPKVKPGSLRDDLFRRDFTINTMAVQLSPGRYGELIDLFQGRDDLAHKIMRVLHEKSFTDDATRIWRALRYEQRLDFHLEPHTLKLLKRDVSMLDTISGDRIRHELELVLKEAYPEKVLRRAEELKALPKLHPALKGNGWLSETFEQARRLSSPVSPPVGLYLAILAYPLTGEEVEQLISRLKLPGLLAQTLRDTSSLKTKAGALSDSKLSSGKIYTILHGYSLTAVTASSLASDSPVARQHTRLFLNKLRYIKPALTGDDLKRLGIAPGPQIREVLDMLHQARLDGRVTGKPEEEGLVRRWLQRHT